MNTQNLLVSLFIQLSFISAGFALPVAEIVENNSSVSCQMHNIEGDDAQYGFTRMSLEHSETRTQRASNEPLYLFSATLYDESGALVRETRVSYGYYDRGITALNSREMAVPTQLFDRECGYLMSDSDSEYVLQARSGALSLFCLVCAID